jgi:hypothetical protein
MAARMPHLPAVVKIEPRTGDNWRERMIADHAAKLARRPDCVHTGAFEPGSDVVLLWRVLDASRDAGASLNVVEISLSERDAIAIEAGRLRELRFRIEPQPVFANDAWWWPGEKWKAAWREHEEPADMGEVHCPYARSLLWVREPGQGRADSRIILDVIETRAVHDDREWVWLVRFKVIRQNIDAFLRARGWGNYERSG